MLSDADPTPPLTDPPTPIQGRLHPASLIFAIINVIRGAFLPLVVALFSGRGEGGRAGFVTYAAFGFLGLSLLWSITRYLSFTYRIEKGELVTREGLIGRQERHIPL